MSLRKQQGIRDQQEKDKLNWNKQKIVLVYMEIISYSPFYYEVVHHLEPRVFQNVCK